MWPLPTFRPLSPPTHPALSAPGLSHSLHHFTLDPLYVHTLGNPFYTWQTFLPLSICSYTSLCPECSSQTFFPENSIHFSKLAEASPALTFSPLNPNPSTTKSELSLPISSFLSTLLTVQSFHIP